MSRKAGASVSFSSKVYDLSTVKKAAYRFSDIFAADIRFDGEDTVCMLSFDSPRSASEVQQIINDFKTEVLDQDLRRSISEETAPIRNAILAHAFSKTGLQRE